MTLTNRIMDAGRIILVALTVAGCAMFGDMHSTPVTVPEVVELSKSGMPAADIIEKMRASGTAYRLKASELAELQAQGVAPAVIDYMQQTYLDAVRCDAAYDDWHHWSQFDGHWYGGTPYGWPSDRTCIRRHQ